jgi:hypothetical protein
MIGPGSGRGLSFVRNTYGETRSLSAAGSPTLAAKYKLSPAKRSRELDGSGKEADAAAWLASPPLMPAKWLLKLTLHAFTGSLAKTQRQKPSCKRRKSARTKRPTTTFQRDSPACVRNSI